ncbi:Aste57867_1579 [Aphanomyces stellatus]|uniref:Aste57867_1579 protein n=1 Tax=Aphanomyces stellatus TaxID=120398 RepID=A0A485K9R7_9STRA|nr:hypothetical protein As57867_001578 [Aphanomyces stellatus]VFT78792.1 Aste57867_1579 [Aphanomyces stellatus]
MGNEGSRPVDAQAPPTAAMGSIRRMDKVIRKKVRGEITYNMKLLIRGERGTGKTSLMARLQGQPIPDIHEPTREIQTATINWSMKGSEEGVKCEVWDVVDFGIPADEPADVTEPDAQGRHQVALVDAQNVDVYQNAHGVIFLMDISKYATLEYVKSQLDAVPVHIPTLVIGTFRDLRSGDLPLKRAIFKEDVHALLYGGPKDHKNPHFRRPLEQHYFEASLTNCYGLKALHAYLGVPFLHLKVATVKQQLRLLETELVNHKHEVDVTIASQKYSAFVSNIAGADIRTGRRLKSNSITDHSVAAVAQSVDDGQSEGTNGDDEDVETSGHDDDVQVATPPSPPTPTPMARKASAVVVAAVQAPVAPPPVVVLDDEEDDLPERGAPLDEDEPYVPLRIEHAKTKVVAPPPPSKKQAAARATEIKTLANPMPPPRRSWDKSETLEDFTVKTDMDKFYSDDESSDDDDEDVVVQTAGRTPARVYRKQAFLYSDSEDDDDDKASKTKANVVALKMQAPAKKMPQVNSDESDDEDATKAKAADVKRPTGPAPIAAPASPKKPLRASAAVVADSDDEDDTVATKQPVAVTLQRTSSDGKATSSPKPKSDSKRSSGDDTIKMTTRASPVASPKATKHAQAKDASSSGDEDKAHVTARTNDVKVDAKMERDAAVTRQTSADERSDQHVMRLASHDDDDDLSEFHPARDVVLSDDDSDNDNTVTQPASPPPLSVAKVETTPHESDDEELIDRPHYTSKRVAAAASVERKRGSSDDSDDLGTNKASREEKLFEEDADEIPTQVVAPVQSKTKGDTASPSAENEPTIARQPSDSDDDGSSPRSKEVKPVVHVLKDTKPVVLSLSESDGDDAFVAGHDDAWCLDDDDDDDDDDGDVALPSTTPAAAPLPVESDDDDDDGREILRPSIKKAQTSLDDCVAFSGGGMPSLTVVNVATSEAVTVATAIPSPKKKKSTTRVGRMHMLDSGSDGSPVVTAKKSVQTTKAAAVSGRRSSGENEFVIEKQGSSFWSDDDDSDRGEMAPRAPPPPKSASATWTSKAAIQTPVAAAPPVQMNSSVLAAIEEAKRAALAMLQSDSVSAPGTRLSLSQPMEADGGGEKKKKTKKKDKTATKKKAASTKRMQVLASDDDDDE